MKRCSKCGVNKERDEFYYDKRSKDGKKSQCITCHNGYEKTRSRTVIREWSKNDKFFDRLGTGEVTIEDIDAYVEKWQSGNYSMTLETFLGLPEDDHVKCLVEGMKNSYNV